MFWMLQLYVFIFLVLVRECNSAKVASTIRRWFVRWFSRCPHINIHTAHMDISIQFTVLENRPISGRVLHYIKIRSLISQLFSFFYLTLLYIIRGYIVSVIQNLMIGFKPLIRSVRSAIYFIVKFNIHIVKDISL